MSKQKAETKNRVATKINIAEKVSKKVVMLAILTFSLIIAFVLVKQIKSNYTASAETTANISACGNLDQANTTYVLTQDVSSDKSCFGVRNNGITLDLNGYAVTYGNFAQSRKNIASTAHLRSIDNFPNNN